MASKSLRPQGKRRILLNVLHEAQEKAGYLSEGSMRAVSESEKIPISRVYGVASFYTMFHTAPQGKYVIEFCGSPSCVLNNGVKLEKFLEQELGIDVGQTTKDGLFSFYKTSCIGCCDEAPAMLLNGTPCTKLTVESLSELIGKLRKDNGKKKVAAVTAKAKIKAKKATPKKAKTR